MKFSRRVKTPVVLQMEAVECGAAALAILLAHHGLYLPLEKLREECGISRDGSNAPNLLKAARRYGCQATGFRFRAETLRKESWPLLLHWEFNHFLVLEGIKGQKVFLNDPAGGHRTIPWSEFETSFTGVALRIQPGPDFRKGGSAPSPWKTLAPKLFDHKTPLFFALLTGLGLIVPGLAIAMFHQVFFDDILSGKQADWRFVLLPAMGLTALLQGTLTWLRSRLLMRWQGKLTIGDSSRFFWHVLRLPMEFFQQRYGAEIASRQQFNDSVAAVLTGPAAGAVLDALVMIFFLALLIQYNLALSIIGVLLSAINVGLLRLAFRRLKEQSMSLQKDLGMAYAVSLGGIQNLETLKAAGNERDFFDKWAGYQSKIALTRQRINNSGQTLQLIPMILGGLNAALIMWVGGFQIMDGWMTVGVFVAFQNLMERFQAPLKNLLNLSQALQNTQVQLARLDDVRNYPVDSRLFSPAPSVAVDGHRLSGLVEIRNLTFGYSRLEKPLIENFHLRIEPGQRVALVGDSGSGKSTVAKLVAGLYEPWSGEILFDGVLRNRIPREAINHSVAIVDQDIFLLAGTASENISLFDSTVPGNDIVRAAKDADIHEDLAALPGAYEATVDEGGRNFSGGQRQRLEIARALAVNPSLLLLDEATSALDPLTEQRVTDNIRRRGCSCLIVAHRLSTIRDCDEILVLSRGKVTQRGTHQEMIKVDGPYRKLVAPENLTVDAAHQEAAGDNE